MRFGSVYRFGDNVALSVGGETRYMTQKAAQSLVQSLSAVLTSIATEPFTQSTCGTQEFRTLSIHEED